MFFRKYRFYKRLLYTVAIINTGLMALGLVGAVRYFREGQPHDGELAFIGLAILVLGVLLPMFLIKKLEDKYREWEMITKKLISEWLTQWIEAQKSRDPDTHILQDFSFWLNMAIIGLNAAQNEIRNPYFRFFTDVAVLIREALKDEDTHKTRRKKS